MAVKIQVEFMWSVMPCSVVRYQHFRGPYCLHLQGEVTLKCWYPITALHVVMTQRNVT
jgi:hypothetical protein